MVVGLAWFGLFVTFLEQNGTERSGVERNETKRNYTSSMIGTEHPQPVTASLSALFGAGRETSGGGGSGGRVACVALSIATVAW